MATTGGVVADTSIWVDFLRLGASGPAGGMKGLLEERRALVCGPVAAEVLTGSSAGSHEDLTALLHRLPWADLDREGWLQVGAVAGSLRRHGTSLPLTDIEIAVATVRAGAALWTRDRDFDRIRSVLPGLRRYRP